MGYEEYLDNLRGMIDDLKVMLADVGKAGADEYSIISQLFTYKFLNDKLVHDFEHREDKSESFDDFIDYADTNTARIKEEYLLENLFKIQNEKDFHITFDKAFKEVSDMNSDVYSVEMASGQKKPLFVPFELLIRDEDKEIELAKRAINILCKYKFDGIYSKGWDYFSTIFEYLIKDYNKDSGPWAEYYTPASAGSIMADILYNDTPVDRVSVYDPAAGSGTLLLSMAHKIGTQNCTVYSQDRSEKSTNFLRINLILNGLAHSLANVKEANTMTNPQHKKGEKIQQFDFIVSNPPFNVDFESDVKAMSADPYGRFFAGIPNIPEQDKSSMAIYLCFLQHILSSLSETGKAAVVVPSGFLTVSKRSSKIAYTIREKIISEGWLRGVISMPANIFATTTTSVSLLFIDKTKDPEEDIVLMDATKLGKKAKLDEGQRTILQPEDEELIVKTFNEKKSIEKFSVVVSKKKIEDNSYSLLCGHYYDAPIDVVDITTEDFSSLMRTYKNELEELFLKEQELEKDILKMLKELKI